MSSLLKNQQQGRMPLVNILTAGSWQEGPKFSVGHSASENQSASREPNAKYPKRVGNTLSNKCWKNKDSAANYIGHNDGGAIKRS